MKWQVERDTGTLDGVNRTYKGSEKRKHNSFYESEVRGYSGILRCMYKVVGDMTRKHEGARVMKNFIATLRSWFLLWKQ